VQIQWQWLTLSVLTGLVIKGFAKFFFLRDFLRWLTVAKKKNLLIEKALVNLLEKSMWLAECRG
jgi:hypothetical protein